MLDSSNDTGTDVLIVRITADQTDYVITVKMKLAAAIKLEGCCSYLCRNRKSLHADQQFYHVLSNHQNRQRLPCHTDINKY